jgi:hypothetical protein
MLPLDSPRWMAFSVYTGTPEQVPHRIASWRESIGGPDEDAQWCDLWDRFLHQGTITDAAYASVPHVVREFARVAPRNRFDYLVQLGLIESARQWKGAPAVPEDLEAAYYGAVTEAKRFAIDCLTLDWPNIEFRCSVPWRACTAMG